MSVCVAGHHKRGVVAAVAGLALLSLAAAAVADGTVSGECRFEKIKGRAGSYIGLYEWNNFLSADAGFADGQSYRCGHEFGGGSYRFTSAAGNYTMYVSQPTFFARPKVVTDVQIIDGQTRTVNPELAIDYSCYVTNDWSWDSPYYQTFVATGTSITRIQWRLAGWNATNIQASVHQDTGGNVTSWPQVGPTKSASPGHGDSWTGYRSGDIPTTPGLTYAIKLTGIGGNFGIMSRVEDGNGYAQGQAYDHNGNPQNRDLNITVFSDNDGTVIPYCKTTSGLGSLSEWQGRGGQTFRATGRSLAAADLWFASDTWDLQMRFKVFENGPGGIQIGPSKKGQGAAQIGDVGLIGCSWAPDEVPLTPGNTYYIETTIAGGAAGYNPYRFDNPVDEYPYGHAYVGDGARPDVDLSMTIMECAQPGPSAEIERSPATFIRSIVRRDDLPDDTFTVRNGGGGLMVYTISDNVNWLSVDPPGGESSGETDPIDIIYDVASLPVGSYTGTITIDAPDATNTPQYVVVHLTVEAPEFAPCDFDEDGDVDQEDFGQFQVCYSGAGIPQNDPTCDGADLHQDGDVDRDDFAKFQQCISGPNVPADSLCAD